MNAASGQSFRGLRARRDRPGRDDLVLGRRHDVDQFVAGGEDELARGDGRAVLGRDDHLVGTVLDRRRFDGGVEARLAIQRREQQPGRQLARVEREVVMAEHARRRDRCRSARPAAPG